MRPFALLSAAIALSGCVGAPAMVPVRDGVPGQLAPERARVVFFMPSWEADRPPYERHPGAAYGYAMAGTLVLDDRGRVFGAVRPGALLVVDLEPGAHAFFAEDTRQIGSTCGLSDCLAIGALRASLVAGRTYGVLVEHPDRFAIGAGSRSRLDLIAADGAPLGQPGWTWLRPDDPATWAGEHDSSVRDIIQAGTQRMSRPGEWDARASTLGGASGE